MSELPCSWDVSCEVCPDLAEAEDSQRNSALWLASTYLWAATGRRYGTCPVTIRPSQQRLAEPAGYQAFPIIPGGQEGLGLAAGPFLFAGRWFNAGCATACCGRSACAVVLRGPVAAVDEVRVDGEVVPASAYRVDVTSGSWLLVRVDGECWPACQNWQVSGDGDGSFEVTYDLGKPLPEALMVATALLACEYLKFLQAGTCKLPSRMTRLSRQGIEVEVEPPSAGDGKTGLAQVDAVIWALNPGRRQAPAVVLSPDLPGGCDRMTVIGAGS